MRRLLQLLAPAACLLALAIPFAASATNQIPDDIVIDGQSSALYGQVPGVPYLTPEYLVKPNMPGVPGGASAVAAVDRIRAHAREKCSAAWRGYKATWEIRGDKLFLAGLTFTPCSGSQRVPLAVLFPDAGDAVFAAWAHGRLIVPIGAATHDIASHHHWDAYWEVVIENGVVLARTRVDQPFRL